MHKVCGFHCENSTSFIKASQLRGYLEPKSHKYFRNTTHLSPKASEKTFSRSSVLWNSPFFFLAPQTLLRALGFHWELMDFGPSEPSPTGRVAVALTQEGG